MRQKRTQRDTQGKPCLDSGGNTATVKDDASRYQMLQEAKLQQWCSVGHGPFGGFAILSQGSPKATRKHRYLSVIHNSSNIIAEVAAKGILWLGITAA